MEWRGLMEKIIFLTAIIGFIILASEIEHYRIRERGRALASLGTHLGFRRKSI